MKAITKTFHEMLRYPTAIVGLITVFALVGLAIYAMIAIPYREALILWEGNKAESAEFSEVLPR